MSHGDTGDKPMYQTVRKYADLDQPTVAEWSQVFYLLDPVEGLRRVRAGKSIDDLLPERLRRPEPPQPEEMASVGPPERPTEKRKKEHDGWVYFIQAGDHGPIKIGITSTVHHRFVNMQVASAVRLFFLGAFRGNGHVEDDLQYEFGPFRFRGEWYWPHPTLLERIALLTDGVEQPEKMSRVPALGFPITHGAPRHG